MEENKKVRGRPRLENTINPMWKEIMLEAGKDGKHLTEVLTILNISWNGHYALLLRNKEYSQAYSEFLKLAETFWFNMAYESMVKNNGIGFNTKLWETIMKNRFKENWKTERQIDVTTMGEKIGDDKNITIEIIKTKND
jgi:hypothetical protein